MTKRKVSRIGETAPFSDEREFHITLDPATLVIDRFASWCMSCKVPVSRDAKRCPSCGRVFSAVTTDCPLAWMPDTIKTLRPDLVFISRDKFPK